MKLTNVRTIITTAAGRMAIAIAVGADTGRRYSGF